MDMEIEAIYQNIQPKYRPQRQIRIEAQNSRRSRWFVPITVCLVLMCVLLVIALILLYINLTAEKDQMKMKYVNTVEEYNKTLNSLSDERDQLERNLNSMTQKNLDLETEVRNLSNSLPNSISASCRYYISKGKKNWADSRRFCKDRGGDLIIIKTEEEQRYISSMTNERVWIGLSDIENEGNMKWVDNTTLNKGFWYEGEPNNYDGNEDCVEMMSPEPFMTNWNDLPCSEKRKWICEN